MLKPLKLEMRILNERTFGNEVAKGSLQRFVKHTCGLEIEISNGKIARNWSDSMAKLRKKLEINLKTPKSSGQARYRSRKLREGSTSKSVDRSTLAQVKLIGG